MKKLRVLILIIILGFSYGSARGSAEQKKTIELQTTSSCSRYYPDGPINIPFKTRADSSKIDLRKPLKLQCILYSIKPENYLLKNTTLSEKSKLHQKLNIEVQFSPEEGEWSPCDVDLGSLNSGCYLLQFNLPEGKTYHRFCVTRKGLIVKYDHKKLLVFVHDRRTGKPLESTVVCRETNTKLNCRAKTDKNGLAVIKIPDETGRLEQPEFFIEALSSSDYLPPVRYSYQKSPDKYKIYVYTDKPAYRQGQKVYAKSIIKKVSPDKMEAVADLPVQVKVETTRHGKILDKTFTTDDDGTIDFSFDLFKNTPLGRYRITVLIPEEKKPILKRPASKDIPYNRYVARTDIKETVDFSVVDYRKPEVTISVKSNKKSYREGEPVKIIISAKHLFGKPAVGKDLKLELLKYSGSREKAFSPTDFFNQITSPYGTSYEYSPFTSSEGDFQDFIKSRLPDTIDYGNFNPYTTVLEPDPGPDFFNPYAQNIINELLTDPVNGFYYLPYYSYYKKTDFKGNIVLEFKKGLPSGKYMINAVFGKYSMRRAAGNTTIKVFGKSTNINLTTDKKIVKLNEKVRIKIKLTDKTAPLKNRNIPINVKIIRKSHPIDIEQKTKVFNKMMTIDSNGSLLLEYTPKQPGYFVASVESKGRQKYEFEKKCAFFASDESIKHKWFDFKKFGIFTDKSSYVSGDTANLLITNPHLESPILLMVEGRKMLHSEVVNFTHNSKFISIPIKRGYGPNIYISGIVLHNSEYYRIETFCSDLIKVTDDDKRIKISIKTDKTEYKPGDMAQVKITTKDKSGNPISTLLSMSVVDKALYLIQPDLTPGIFNHFYSYFDNDVITATVSDFDKETFRNLPLRSKYGDGDYVNTYLYTKIIYYKNYHYHDSIINPFVRYYRTLSSVRKYFPDTCYYNPKIITDKNGEATVNFRMPDSLTTWRVTARGISKDARVGEDKIDIKVDNKYFVRLLTPKFIRERDELEIRGVVHNHLNSDQETKLELKADGIKLLDDSQRFLNVKSGSTATASWRVKAFKSGNAVFTLNFSSKAESGKKRIEVPVLPHGFKKRISKSGMTESDSSIDFSLPENGVSENSFVTIRLYPSIVSSIMPSLDFLNNNSYGCTEKAINQFFPFLMVTRAINRLSKADPETSLKTDEKINTGIRNTLVLGYETFGWGWFTGDPDMREFPTAYVLYGLKQAQKAGFNIDHNLLDGIERHLMHEFILNSGKFSNERNEYNTSAYIFFCSCQAQKIEEAKSKAESIYNVRKKLNSYGKAVAAIGFYNLGLKSKADKMIGMLEKEALTVDDMIYWDTGNTETEWMKNKTEATAWVLSAFIKIKPDSPLIPKTVKYLISVKQGDRWHTTKDTAAVIMALTDFMLLTGETNADFNYSFSLNGEEIKKGAFGNKDVTGEGITIRIPVEKFRKQNKITFSKNGKGQLYFDVYYDYYTSDENLKAKSEKVKIKREYFLAGKEKTDDNTGGLPPLNPKSAVINSDDALLVRVTINNDNILNYVTVEDPLPSGFEFVTNYSKTQGFQYVYYDHREENDEKRLIFFSQLFKGPNVLEYYISPETTGTFHTMPATVETMYTPGVRGNSDEMVIKVVDGKEGHGEVKTKSSSNN